MSDDYHRIESVRFCIGTHDEISPHEMQDTVSYIFKHKIHPELSFLLTQCAEGQLISLDTMEINLGEINYENLQHNLPQLVLKKLREQLLEARQTRAFLQQTIQPRPLQILIYLLQYGSTPWWAPDSNSRSMKFWINQSLKESPTQFLSFLDKNLHHQDIYTRLKNNTNPTILDKLRDLSNSEGNFIPPDSKLHDFIELRKKNTQSNPIKDLINFLKSKPLTSSLKDLKTLLQQAEVNNSQEKIHQTLVATLQTSKLRKKVMQRLTKNDRQQLLHYLFSSRSIELIDQTEAIIGLIEYHFADTPHITQPIHIRLWDSSIEYFLLNTNSKSHIKTLLEVIQIDKHLVVEDFSQSYKKFITQFHPLSHPVQQEIEKWIHITTRQNTTPPQTTSKLTKNDDGTINQNPHKKNHSEARKTDSDMYTEHLLPININNSSDDSSIKSMLDLWGIMLEQLWETDPISVIHQISDITLSGSLSETYHQALPSTLIESYIKTIYPDLYGTFLSLIEDLQILHTHELLPGYVNEKTIDLIIKPVIMTALGSQHIVSHTSHSITTLVLKTLAHQQGELPIYYLQKLYDKINSSSFIGTNSSHLPSIITANINVHKFYKVFTEDLLAEIDPYLSRQLHIQIGKRTSEIHHYSSESPLEIKQRIFDQCLKILPHVWPNHARPNQIINAALKDLGLTDPAEDSTSFVIELNLIDCLLSSNKKTPDDKELLQTIRKLRKEASHLIIPRIARSLQKSDFLKQFHLSSINLQIEILTTIAPQPTTILKALISRIKNTSSPPPEKSLWQRAILTIKELYLHELKPHKIIAHFLLQEAIPLKEQAQKILQISSPRPRPGDNRLDIILQHLATGEDLIPSQQIAEISTKQPELSPFIKDLVDTFTAIIIRKGNQKNASKIFRPLLQNNLLSPQELTSRLLQSAADYYEENLSNFAQTHWSLIQDLAATYEDPYTLITIHQSVSTVIEAKDIVLPQLPGSSQTVFESPPPETPVYLTPTQSLSQEDKPELITDINHEVWLVKNAGLVIFAPYIEMLLERAGLLHNKRFPGEDQAIRGIFLLHHLITGSSEAEEPQLLLNRILCNVSLNQALPAFINPGDDWQELTNGLIKAVIHHWNTLGDTSSDSLLNTFVKREGSLRFTKEEGWTLYVPEGPYDMLLTSLPWSISVIKLSWMEQPLRVEWK